MSESDDKIKKRRALKIEELEPIEETPKQKQYRLREEQGIEILSASMAVLLAD